MVTQTLIEKADKLTADDGIPNNVSELFQDQIMTVRTSRKILIGSLRDGRLKVNSPIKVVFSKEADSFIAEAMELNEFGFGNNEAEALSDLQRTIVELFLTLDEDKSHLGKDLQLLREKLNEHISLRTL